MAHGTEEEKLGGAYTSRATATATASFNRCNLPFRQSNGNTFMSKTMWTATHSWRGETAAGRSRGAAV